MNKLSVIVLLLISLAGCLVTRPVRCAGSTVAQTCEKSGNTNIARMESLWHCDNYNCANLDPSQPDNHAWWCGKYFEDDCETGDFGGYGNNMVALLDWTGTVPDPTDTTHVRITAMINFDTEPGYDYLYLEYATPIGWNYVRIFNGSGTGVAINEVFRILPGLYTGAGGDEITLRWEFISDDEWSDSDCLFPTVGAAQIDLITVYFNGVQQGEVEDCDSASQQWFPALPEPVGTYYATTDPDTFPPPQDPWSSVGDGQVSFPAVVGSSIWLGKGNRHNPDNAKVWTITLTGAEADKYGVSEVRGYINDGQVVELPAAPITGIKDTPGPPRQRTFTATISPQPDWEVARIVRSKAVTVSGKAEISVDSYTHCQELISAGDHSTMTGWAGVRGDDDIRITDVYVFPDLVAIDPLGGHAFIPPAGSGEWAQMIIYTDPEGEPRPQGGVRWYTAGGGFQAEEEYSWTIVMDSKAVEDFDSYLFDSNSARHLYFKMEADDLTDVSGSVMSESLNVKAYPNPFNPRITISYGITAPSHVRLQIFDLRGRIITTLADQSMPAGLHETIWNGHDSNGRSVPSGTYFYRVSAGPNTETRRMVLVR